jgi:hypothetical protein
MQQNEMRPAAEATAMRGAGFGHQPGNRPLNTNTAAISEEENERLTEKPPRPAARVPEVCTRAMARRLQSNVLRCVALERDIPTFLKARAGEAFIALAKIDGKEALAFAKRLVTLCETLLSEGVAHEGR